MKKSSRQQGDTPTVESVDGVQELDIAKVHPNPWNPNVVPEHVMAALRENMREVGFVQPILVRPHPDIPGEFQIVDGEHRYHTAQLEKATTILAYVRELSEGEARAQTLAMNKLRGEMAPEQIARMARQLDMSPEEVARLTGYTEVELRALDRLLDERIVDDVSRAGSGDAEDEAEPAFERITFRVPESVARLVHSELTLRKDLMGQGTEDYEALREIAVRSAQVSSDELRRDLA